MISFETNNFYFIHVYFIALSIELSLQSIFFTLLFFTLYFSPNRKPSLRATRIKKNAEERVLCGKFFGENGEIRWLMKRERRKVYERTGG